MKVTIITTEYVNSHGHEPRGVGVYIFSAEKNSPGGRLGRHICCRGGGQTYAEAKKEATAWAKENGHEVIWTMP